MAAYSDRLADDYLSLLQKLLQILKIDRDAACTQAHTHILGALLQPVMYTQSLTTYNMEKALFKMPYVH